MRPTPHPGLALASATLVGAMLSAPLSADDTEVFFGRPDPGTNIYPNVLFVLDTSGSMTWGDPGETGSRLSRMKQAMDTILDNSANVNVGLMRFNGSSGGGAVLYPITPIDEEVCSGADCGEVNLSYQIEHNMDDVEEYIGNGTIEHWGNILSMGTGQGNPQEVGLRFNDIEIPQGATITEARIAFTAYSSDKEPASLQIRAERTDDAARYEDQARNLSARADTNAVVNWSPGAWWTNGVYLTPDIGSVVQEVVDRSGWCGSNSIALQIRGAGTRSARSFNNSNTDAPRLILSYDANSIPANGGCVERTAVAAVAQGSDDAIERRGRTRRVRSRDDVLRLSTRDTNRQQQYLGVRFDKLGIPPGSDIREATLQFEVRAPSPANGQSKVVIRAQAHDDAPTFVENKGNLSYRPTVSPSVSWSPANPAANTKLDTPDLQALVQAVVDRPGWEAENAMVFRLDSAEKKDFREFESFEGEQAAAAKLRVVYRTKIGGTDIATIVARDRLKETVRGLTATGGTPIVDAYYEAAQYYLGGNVDYGKRRGTGSGNRSHRVSHPTSYTGGTVSRGSECSDFYLETDSCKSEKITGTPRYISPLADSCQTNHIVFLSDGEPTSNSATNRVRSLIGAPSCTRENGQASSELCGRELATWLHETDHNQTISRAQNINTYTIGFNNKSDFLGDLAAAGGGRYFDAASAEDLVYVFQNILSDVLAVDTSFVAPAATVNQFNRLTHRDDIYFALFRPDTRPTWDGNLKRYKIEDQPDGTVSIVDVLGNDAVDPETGFFDKQAKSWWSSGVDGSSVSEGGAAEQQTLEGHGGSGSRQMYTYTGTYPLPSGGVDLTQDAHDLHEDNTRVSETLLGIPESFGTSEERASYRENLLKWARGVDVLDDNLNGDEEEVRTHIGDPMHSRPVIVNYANGNDPYTTIYVATNEGFLHAIDRKHGEELYAFMPQELLPNVSRFFDNEASTRHPYGLDGALTVWSDDANENVMIDADETAYLYSGMRRGGHSMYAFDISERTKPTLAWKISRGDTGFEELGQTWSRAVPSRLMIDGVEKDVVVFAAGYDTNQDPDTSGLLLARSDDTMGRGIYIVEAATGKRVWAGLGTPDNADRHFPAMSYSIPSDVRVVDVNQDGLMDQFYVGDTGGQIWRFDVAPYHQGGAADLVDGGVMADIGGSSLTDSRRFYYEPDVALIESGGERFFSISIGSGWRAHPLNDQIEDRFYMLRSNDVTRKPEGYGKQVGIGPLATWVPVTESDLTNVTDDIDPSTSDHGWMLELEANGEKVLGDSVTVNNQIVFTSYRPDLTADACSTAIGSGVIYALDVLDGSAALDSDKDGEDEKEDRETPLVHGGIPPEPAALITEENTTILVGPEQIDVPFAQPERTYWRDTSAEMAEEGGAFASSDDDPQ